jgi:nucleotide-binding universal stress UspA family protein
MFSTIVHPTDFSEASIPALKSAHELAGKLGSKLLVCFFAHPPLIASGNTLTDPKTSETRDIAAELESHQPNDPSVERTLRIVVTEQSTRVKTLLGFLEEMDCDLLVLGIHKRAGVAGWLGASITEEVVRRAECAVMVVKQHGDDEDIVEQ